MPAQNFDRHTLDLARRSFRGDLRPALDRLRKGRPLVPRTPDYDAALTLAEWATLMLDYIAARRRTPSHREQGTPAAEECWQIAESMADALPPPCPPCPPRT